MNAGVADGVDRVGLIVHEGVGHALAMERGGHVGNNGKAIEGMVARTSALSVQAFSTTLPYKVLMEECAWCQIHEYLHSVLC